MDERGEGAGGSRTWQWVTPLTQELRLATVMTGGVSLAIWMGGVARELNLLEQASRLRQVDVDGTPPLPVEPLDAKATPTDRSRRRYLELLDLLDLTVDADVLSGTSAGGLNAAFLAFTRARSGTLDRLRDVWLDVGAFEKLLRDPTNTELPSLLQGDGVLLTGVEDAIGKMSAGPVSPVSPPATDVFITTTLLSGETSRFADHNGTVVQDVDHRGVFRFDEGALVAGGAKQALALAARSSASFPAAFEPSFVPFDTAPGSDTSGLHPPMGGYANTTRDHWAADGGLLMNQPIRPLLQTVFRRPASRQVRRVLLYVVPTTGPNPDARATPAPDRFDQPLSMAHALLEDLGAALHQSISADLQAIRDHNDRVDSLSDTRLRLAELAVRMGMTGAQRLLSAQLLADYRARQSVWLVRPLIIAFMKTLTTMAPEAMPAEWRAELAPGRNAEERCRDEAAGAVAATWPSALPESGDYAALADFGLAAFEGAQAIVITMIRRAFVLADDRSRREKLAEAVGRVHVALPASRPEVGAIVAAAVPSPSAHGGSALTDAARSAALQFAAALGGPPPEGEPVPPAEGDPLPPPVDAPAGPPGLHDELPAAWGALARVVVDTFPTFQDLLRDTPAAGVQSGRATQRETRGQLRARNRPELETYVRYLGGTDGDQTAPGVDVVALRLFDLHVATRAVLPVAVEVEQPVELVQVSADTRTPLDPERATAARKLTGLQLHHFGAFYKSSWRANDWMWGRLDGAGWLVNLLLDPRRIVTVVETRTDDPDTRDDLWFYAQLVRLVGGEPGGEAVSPPGEIPEVRLTADAVKAELEQFLADRDRPIPASLPLTSMWLALDLQRWIAVDELPVVATQMLLNASSHPTHWAADLLRLVGQPELAMAASQQASRLVMSGGRSATGKAMRRAADAPAPITTPDPAAVAAHVRTCPVPDEKLPGDLGSPLFTRTATKALAVTAGAVTTSARPLAGFRSVLATLRTITLAGYRGAVVTKGWPRKLMLLGAVLVAVGIIAALQGDTIVGVAGMTIALAGAYTITVATFDVGRRLIVPLVSVTVVGLLIAPAFPVVRRSLFGTSDTDLGIFGRDVVPWLQSPFWHVLVVVGGLVVLALLIGVVPRLVSRRRR